MRLFVCLAIALLSAGMVGCGEDDEEMPATCNASVCTGCCTSAGECVAGLADEACGIGGVGCAECPTAKTCQAGMCVDACTSTNCDGCCTASGTCVSGTSDSQCGHDGYRCVSCQADEYCSSSGYCYEN